MKYTQGNIGRIFVVRFDDDEDLLEGLKISLNKKIFRQELYIYSER